LFSSTVRNGHGENLFTLDGHTVNVTQPFNVHAVTEKGVSHFSVVYEGLFLGVSRFVCSFASFSSSI